LIAQPVKARMRMGKRQCQTVVVDKSNWAKSRALARLWESTFIEIDEVRDRDNIGAIGNTVLLFLSFKPRCSEIVPAQLGTEAVPNREVALVSPAAVFET